MISCTGEAKRELLNIDSNPKGKACQPFLGFKDHLLPALMIVTKSDDDSLAKIKLTPKDDVAYDFIKHISDSRSRFNSIPREEGVLLLLIGVFVADVKILQVVEGYAYTEG